MLETIAVALTIIFSLAGFAVAAWSYTDTKRKFSHQQFLSDREIKRKEADERFNERTRLGKKND
jgi:hypothetical protein